MTKNEGNLLIAWFMTEEPEVLKRDLLKAGTIESLRFDSWDDIMPIYRKICDMNGPEMPEGAIMQTEEMDSWSDRIGDITCAILDVDLEDAWKEIVNNLEVLTEKCLRLSIVRT